MSYVKSCNVDVLKTFDLRVRAANNFSPGLYSTLTTGPQQVYGSPLTWEYILLLSDVQAIKEQHSTIISNNYVILSTNTIYISTLLDNTLSTLSSYVFSNYEQLENSNVFLQGTLFYNVSNFYEQTDMIPYPSTISTIVYNFSTLSTQIQNIIPTLTFLSTTSTLYLYELSTVKSIYPSLVPSISTISTLNVNYSTLLTSTLKNSESNLQSTVSASIYRYLLNASTTYYSFQSTLAYTSTFLISTYSSQYLTYSTVNGLTFNDSFSTIQSKFSSFSSLVGYQLSSVDVLYSNRILAQISTATSLETNNINRNFSTLLSSITGTYSTLINTISTSQNIIDNNSTNIYKLSTQYTTFQTLSVGVALLDFYSSISRIQTFYELDFYLNNIPISTYYLPSSLSAGDLITNQSIATSYLENQFIYNSTLLSGVFASNTSNAYYNIIKAYRANNIPLIDTVCNSMYLSSFISSFINPSLISTAYGQYSTLAKSTISQTYKIVVQSERLGIRNTSNIFITATNLSSSRSSITGSAFLSLSNEMGLLTSTSFNNLISYTFGSFRSNSEETLRILNQAETSNYTIMTKYISNITDHTIQDGYYHNLSTLFNSDFSTTKGILTSTTLNLLNTDSTFIRYLSTISSLSTFYYRNISTFQSTIFKITQSTFASSLSSVRIFNSSILGTQLSFLGPIASSFSTFLEESVYSTLSTVMNEENTSLCNFILDTSNVLNDRLIEISNIVNECNAAQSRNVSNFVISTNTSRSNILSGIYSNSINLSISQIVLSTFTTLSSIFVDAPLTMFEGGTNQIQQTRSPLHISYYGRDSIQNLLYVNPTKNEVVVNSLKIIGNNSVTFSNTFSTLGIDLNQYQNFNVDIQTMSNANPKIELFINFSTPCIFTQQGNINININQATANEIAAGRFLNINNLGPQIRLNITRTFGYLKYKYLSINGIPFISEINDFTRTTSTVLPPGLVTTITNTNENNFIGIVTDAIGNIFVTDTNTNSIIKYDIVTSSLSTLTDGLNIPYNLTIDYNNNMYVTSFGNSTIYKVTPAGVKTIVCTQIPSPVGIVVDSTATYLYVSSLVTNRIYQLDITQSFPIIITSQNNFAGSVDGVAGYADGIGPAARFRLVFGMTIDSTQTMYVTDYGNNSIRKIVLSTKLVTTIAGSSIGEAGNTIGNRTTSPHVLTNVIESNFSGTNARFNKPTGIVADNLGNLFVCDSLNYAIRRIVLTTNDIITISGIEGGGYFDGPILQAKYSQLYGIIINAGKSNLFACDLNKIRQIGYDINAITGNSASEINASTAEEAATRYCVTLLDSITPIIINCIVDSNNKLFLLSATGIIYKYDLSSLILTTFATLSTNSGYGLTIDSSNNLYATDGLTTVYKITAVGVVTTVLNVASPKAITINADGTTLYVSCIGYIIEIVPNSITQTTFNYVANSPQTWTPSTTSVYVILRGAAGGCHGDFSFFGSAGGTVSGFLNVTSGHQYTLILGRGGANAGDWWTESGEGGFGGGGNGNGGQYGGSGGGGRAAIQFTAGTDIVTAGGGAGSYYYNQGGVGGEINGGGATNGTPYQGDPGPYQGGGGGGYLGGAPGRGGTSYVTNLIGAVATAGTAGNGIHANPGIYGNASIVIYTAGVKVIAGSTTTGIIDGVGSNATLSSTISGIAYVSTAAEVLYFSEFENQTIRRLQLSSSNVVTISGTAGIPGSGNGIGKNAQFNGPVDIKSDLSGNLYVSDLFNNAIRKIDIASVVVTTLAGNTGSNVYPPTTNPDGIVNQAKLFGPYGIAFDNPAPVAGSYRDLYVIDRFGQSIRGFYSSFTKATLPMSTIINYNNSTIVLYQQQMSTIRISTSTVASLTFVQYLNTLSSYNNTLNAPPSATKLIFVNAASNALSNAIVQSNIAVNASSITSFNSLSINTISTNASAQFTTLSYNANVFLANASNLLVNSLSNSNIALNSLTSAQASFIAASNAYIGAVNAAVQVTIEQNFSYVGYDQYFYVPSGVTRITVELLGASGSTAYTGDGSTRGGYVYGDLLVIPGEFYIVVVGGQNNDGGNQYGGGGAGSYGYGGSGGGRSALMQNFQDVVTAGGGGGDSYYTNGGLGGGLEGGQGYYGAQGGTQINGGNASGFGATNGNPQYGGNGNGGGAGGGGGYYGGGGGGGWGYGGGGGSSYISRLIGSIVNTQGGGASSPANASAYYPPLTGHGRVKISWLDSGGGTGTGTSTGTGSSSGTGTDRGTSGGAPILGSSYISSGPPYYMSWTPYLSLSPDFYTLYIYQSFDGFSFSFLESQITNNTYYESYSIRPGRYYQYEVEASYSGLTFMSAMSSTSYYAPPEE